MTFNELILQQLNIRDELEKKDINYYKAFQDLRMKLSMAKFDDDLEKLEESKPSVIDNDKLIDRINQLQIKIDSLLDQLQQKNKVNKQLEKDNGLLKSKISNLNFEIVEKNKAIETINDELLSCNIQNNVLANKVDELTKENDKLVERWMQRVSQDAEKLNDVNEFLQANMK